MGGFDDLVAQLDPVDNNRKGDDFERVCKWYLENDPTYKPLLKHVWLWKKWPGRKNIDAGVDLVAEDHNGKFWAIQAKAHKPGSSISKAKIDKFISESSRPVFSHRLLIATTDKRDHLATGLMDDLDIPFIGLTRLREADDYLDWPESLTDLRPSKLLKPKQPHEYQQAAINDVEKGFKNADRGQLIMACGTGKTLTAWFITEKLAAQRTLVLVPSLSLLKQTMREWQMANPKKPFATLPVCSDETVGGLGEDAAVSHISDLGVPVTTDSVKIAEFLRKRSGPRVVFSTYQSSPQIAEAFTLGRVPAFDLVVADEAHRVAGQVSSDFATVLDPTAIKAKRRLFMTATPRFFTGRLLREAKQADYEVASMDDETKFGTVFHRLTFSEAIDRDLLTDYQVAIIGVDDATYRQWAEHGALVTLDGKKHTDARSLAGQIGLAKAMKKFDLRRMITFHSRVKTSKEFAASMSAVLDWMPPRQRPTGRLWADYASGDMSAGERAVLIQHLKRLDDGERGLLANARCLAEGVDVPALDGVAFIDPRRSEVDIVQAVGRAIRKSDDKTIGTIVIPVFIDTDEDAEVALDSSVFKPVWDVIKALRAHDTELGEQLDVLRREMGRKGGKPRLPAKIHVDVPATVGQDFARAFEVRVIEKTTATWEFWFGLLQKYVAERGHSRVQRGEVFEGRFLDQWINRQRTLFGRGQLPAARSEQLEKVPGWTWDYRTDRWEECFALLQDYVAIHGHARISRSYLTADQTRLGEWCKTQRLKYGKGDLDDDRVSRLQALPGWSWDPNADRWEQGFEYLMQFVDENGHARIPRDYRVADYRLGNWVATQRMAFDKDDLDPERKQRLEAIAGWVWDPFADQWEAAFDLLRDFVAEHGHAQVPSRYKVKGQSLGSWVMKQRAQHDKGQLDDDRKGRLEALPAWTWDPHQDKWEEGFAKLVQYVESCGNARVPASYELDGYPLGRWVVKQRANRASDLLKPERQTRLEALPGWTWDRLNDQWEENFERLSRYVRSSGSANIPKSLKFDGFPLGQWVNSQRSNRPDPEKSRRLESLPGWTWNSVTDRWETGFSHLLRYVAAQGHTGVPKDYRLDSYPLGNWVANQRSAYARDYLDESRVARLEGVDGWIWNSKAAGWEIAYQHLCDFVGKHGHARVPFKHKQDSFGLGAWVVKQRVKRQKLSPEQQRRLEALPGWDWNPPMGRIRLDTDLSSQPR